MGSINKKLAGSLELLMERQGEGRRIFRSSEFPREDRERLLRNGFLQPVIQGWLMLSSPGARPNDTTPWFSSVWEFCAQYCAHRFGERWHLSAGDSLLHHAENTAIPKRIRVQAEQGTNHNLSLPFDTVLSDLKAARFPDESEVIAKDGLRLFTPEAALLRVPEAFYRRYPVEAQTVLANVKNISWLLQRLVSDGQSVVAGRLAGAFRHVGMDSVADGIARTMRDAERFFREKDPFEEREPIGRNATEGTISAIPAVPIASKTHTRLSQLWSRMRKPILAAFPQPPGRPVNDVEVRGYLQKVEEAYVEDAYHSLSIEGYHVTPELLERVRTGQWNSLRIPADREQHNALAARGYWQAFQKVKESVAAALKGDNSGRTARTEHSFWYQQMFQPFAAAGLYDENQLIGYRNQPVYLRGSRHVPMRWERVGEAMDVLFDLLEAEPEPAVRAAAGHLLFGYIHPYPDGNGRNARFLMNVMLASGGYPWTIIRTEDRSVYLDAMQTACVDQDFDPYARFLSNRVRQTIKHNARAVADKEEESAATIEDVEESTATNEGHLFPG